MLGSPEGLITELFEEKQIKELQKSVNGFLNGLGPNHLIYNITYHSDKEEFGKMYTAMVVYRIMPSGTEDIMPRY